MSKERHLEPRKDKSAATSGSTRSRIPRPIKRVSTLSIEPTSVSSIPVTTMASAKIQATAGRHDVNHPSISSISSKQSTTEQAPEDRIQVVDDNTKETDSKVGAEDPDTSATPSATLLSKITTEEWQALVDEFVSYSRPETCPAYAYDPETPPSRFVTLGTLVRDCKWNHRVYFAKVGEFYLPRPSRITFHPQADGFQLPTDEVLFKPRPKRESVAKLRPRGKDESWDDWQWDQYVSYIRLLVDYFLMHEEPKWDPAYESRVEYLCREDVRTAICQRFGLSYGEYLRDMLLDEKAFRDQEHNSQFAALSFIADAVKLVEDELGLQKERMSGFGEGRNSTNVDSWLVDVDVKHQDKRSLKAEKTPHDEITDPSTHLRSSSAYSITRTRVDLRKKEPPPIPPKSEAMSAWVPGQFSSMSSTTTVRSSSANRQTNLSCSSTKSTAGLHPSRHLKHSSSGFSMSSVATGTSGGLSTALPVAVEVAMTQSLGVGSLEPEQSTSRRASQRVSHEEWKLLVDELLSYLDPATCPEYVLNPNTPIYQLVTLGTLIQACQWTERVYYTKIGNYYLPRPSRLSFEPYSDGFQIPPDDGDLYPRPLLARLRPRKKTESWGAWLDEQGYFHIRFLVDYYLTHVEPRWDSTKESRLEYLCRQEVRTSICEQFGLNHESYLDFLMLDDTNREREFVGRFDALCFIAVSVFSANGRGSPFAAMIKKLFGKSLKDACGSNLILSLWFPSWSFPAPPRKFGRRHEKHLWITIGSYERNPSLVYLDFPGEEPQDLEFAGGYKPEDPESDDTDDELFGLKP
ncbi:hypothetical protein BJ508DRAFT_332116 [Ascobolus immersus RN42]|uniref:Uncharacterized protein n=1 Tax=Ascobolus immersus RN42 TaxID=1160509 RepID=A0A3N4HQY6_ASCIM|nr:hypothetical protein BJ508DRAFT_332116 [Ascobolus immersus RN42]